MKNALAPALVLAFTILSAAQTQTAEPLSVAAEQVQRVEILYFPERILVRAALSPERLELGYQYKLEIRDVRYSAEWQQLLSLLRETSVKPSGMLMTIAPPCFYSTKTDGALHRCTSTSSAQVAP
jgi:hypothetical protein